MLLSVDDSTKCAFQNALAGTNQHDLEIVLHRLSFTDPNVRVALSGQYPITQVEASGISDSVRRTVLPPGQDLVRP